MTKRLNEEKKFRRDLKKCSKRQYDLELIQRAFKMLQEGQTFPRNMKPHKLKGKYAGWWECHIASDWLLIYRVDDDTVYLARTGTHAALFE